MSLACGNSFKLLSQQKTESWTPSGAYAYPKTPARRVQRLNLGGLGDGSISKIKEMLHKVELSVSPYDTAWVAMVPAGDSSSQSRFPECLNWILENQNPDGSWAFHPSDPLLVKDSLSSTLACILALQKWNVGQRLVNRGLDFIGSNKWAATDSKQKSPIGFDVIFPGMIERAEHMGLALPINTSSLDAMLNKRDLEVQSALRSGLEGKKKYLAYVAEGFNKLDDWKDVMKYQRSNGSLFNSPATTAAALLHLNDDKCFTYLNSLLQRYRNAVPTIYPLDIYARLCTIDNLERLGIDQYFRIEIQTILDEIYRCWMQGDDEIFSDITCLALGFRLLRMNGYDVSSDVFAGLDEQEQFFNSVSEQYKGTNTILELYKASLMLILPSEPILEKLYVWTSSFLKLALGKGAVGEKKLHKEVEYALKYPHASLERLENRKSIELHEVDNVQLLKTAYRCSNSDNKYLLELSLKDFNACQYIHKKELNILERWVKEYRMDELKFARQKITYGFFAAAAVLFSPEHSDARIAWAKFTVLVTLIDDLFDVGGSEEELLNMFELVKKWDSHSEVGFCSEQIEIIFSAVYDTTNEFAVKAGIEQGRSVKDHLIEIWLILLETMWREFEWARGTKSLPSVDDYMSSAYVSVALGPVALVPLYFLGAKLSEEAVKSKEYDDLFMHMSVISRLLNDLTTVKRESEQGKLNSLSLRVIHGNGSISEEDAISETKRLIESHRRELLRMVVQTEGSVVPKVCKDVFWKTSKIVHLFYMGKDGFSSPHEMISAINTVIHNPILLPPY
ncbi:terpene synthase 6, chloroplastic isoform X2 [Manihot esculenta]|uniref:ent-kaurene synthase n=1 Tax=Manihot esculenta TaxID=3983 RepID=A0A2C9U7I9_MANES|nr:terpene synthase 6, chloroplastic isoform X2 [Manihot esculenta]OAY25859.1 hypothetical protein MANES_16G000900v8 [Manihot esculenta]